MSVELLRHGHDRVSTPRIFRGVGALSDGKLAVLTFNSNVAISGGGQSENNNTPKLYVSIVNPDGTTLFKSGFTVGSSNNDQRLGMLASLAVDSSNGIHVIYTYRTAPQAGVTLAQGQTLRYRKLTYDGSSLVVGTEATLENSVGYYGGIDIDVPRGASVTLPLIAYTHTTDGEVFSANLVQSTGSNKLQIAPSVGSRSLGISLALSNAVDVATYKWIVSLFQQMPGVDSGDRILHGTGSTTTTPVLTSTLANGLNIGLGNGIRKLEAHRDGTKFMIFGVTQTNTLSLFYAAYNVADMSVATTSRNVNLLGKFAANPGYEFCSTQYISGSRPSLVAYIHDGKNIYAQVCSADLSTRYSEKWRMDRLYFGRDIEPALISSGERGVLASSLKVTSDHPEAKLVALYDRVPSGSIPLSVVTPTGGATVSRSNETIRIAVNGSPNYNLVGQVQVQIADNQNFTSAASYYSGFRTFLSAVTVDVELPEHALSQGLYYMRSRIVDQIGTTTNWSDATSFTVRHIPIPYRTVPEPGGTAFYANGGVTFSWDFSDLDPTDFQTAYRIEVFNAAGTGVADTGKISSVAERSRLVTLDSALIGATLRAKITLWDSDDVAGFDSYQFLLTSAPVVDLTFPNMTDALTTARPVYAWTNTLPAGRTQSQYRITVRKGGTVVWDSGVINGSATTLIQPAGYLSNMQYYTATVWIKDSLGLTATDTNEFRPYWAAPMQCDAPFVDMTSYNEFGFVYITAVPPAVDPALNPEVVLLRRSLASNSDWEEVGAQPVGVRVSYSFVDSSLPAGVDSYYAIVLRTTAADGSVSIGDPDNSEMIKISAPPANYWLVSLDDPNKNTILYSVNSDSYTNEKEQEVTIIANRGRWVDEGDNIGVSGTLGISVYDREAGLGNAPIFNYLKNPRLIGTGTGVNGVNSWTLGAGSYITYRTPALSPTGKIDCIALGNASDAYLVQDVPRRAGAHNLALFVETSLVASGANKKIIIEAVCKSAAGATVGTYTKTYNLTLSGSSMRPVGATVITSPLGAQFDWFRLDNPFTAPAGTNSIVVTLRTQVASGSYVALGGAMLYDSINTAVKFFDGKTNGAEFMNPDALDSISYTPGKMTARMTRRRIMELVQSDEQLYLRTPFGDFWKVATGQIGVERIAGTGENEFVRLTIPYLELR